MRAVLRGRLPRAGPMQLTGSSRAATPGAEARQLASPSSGDHHLPQPLDPARGRDEARLDRDAEVAEVVVPEAEGSTTGEVIAEARLAGEVCAAAGASGLDGRHVVLRGSGWLVPSHKTSTTQSQSVRDSFRIG